MHHPNTCGCSRSSGGFPRTANVSQKSVPRRRVFIQNLITPVAVEANGRRAKKGAGRTGKVCQSFTEQFGPVNAAIANSFFRARGPALSNGFAGEMNDRVETCPWAKFNFIFFRKPKRARTIRTRSSEKGFGLVTAGAKSCHQGRANQAVGTRDENSHCSEAPWPVRIILD